MIIKILLLVVFWMMMRRFLRGLAKKSTKNKTRFQSGRPSSSSESANKSGGKEAEDPFKKITQQDIDDADFEEIP